MNAQSTYGWLIDIGGGVMNKYLSTVGLFATPVLVLTACGSDSTESRSTDSGNTGSFTGAVNDVVLDVLLAPATAVRFTETLTFLNQNVTN